MIAVSEPDRLPRPKDRWDKADIILKGALAVLLPAAITFFSIYTEWRRSQEAESSRSYQALVQTLSSREAVGADVKSKMFATLMQHYFTGPDRKKIVVLELLAMNLDEQFQLRPLFETLDGELTDETDRRELKRVVRNLVAKEVAAIRAAGGETCEMQLTRGETVLASCAPVALKLLNVEEDRILVNQIVPDEVGFEINYFDMPLTDNTTIGELTYSLVLRETDVTTSAAKVRVVIFPRHSYSIQSRLAFDQLVGRYLAPTVQFSPPGEGGQRAPR